MATVKTYFAPALLGFAVLLGWEGVTRAFAIPVYVLPGPLAVLQTLISDGPSLVAALWVTLRIALAALALAAILGVALALLMAQSRWIERALAPYAVMLQVTPVVSIAPLIIIYVDNVFGALLICAWIVAFFPIISNTLLGLKSAPRGLVELFRLYGANRWQTFAYLQWPATLPYFLSGLRISGGLALIGAVVAEFVAGTGGAETGLAYRILEAGYRLQIPRMFAALALLSAAGVAIYGLLGWLSKRMLYRWHESASADHA